MSQRCVGMHNKLAQLPFCPPDSYLGHYMDNLDLFFHGLGLRSRDILDKFACVVTLGITGLDIPL